MQCVLDCRGRRPRVRRAVVVVLRLVRRRADDDPVDVALVPSASDSNSSKVSVLLHNRKQLLFASK